MSPLIHPCRPPVRVPPPAGACRRAAVILLGAVLLLAAPRPCVSRPFPPGDTGHPRLLLSRADVLAMRAALGTAPLLDSTFSRARARVDRALAAPMDVPRPADAGGYTHERHKQNYTEMQLAGILYQVTQDGRYARFVREMLLRYAAMYPQLGRHPMASGEAAGRIFWQTLNETVWLVHASQAYDCVYDMLSASDRETIETRLFRPMARFFTVDHAAEHDRIHNHGTWTTTAVGMLGFALGDTSLVTQALYGTRKDGSGGYMRQLDELFSPDGYYTEGPYYTRYALMPFFLFAQAIANNRPELRIFAYRDQILRKAFSAAMQQTAPGGAFIPFNDALKEKSYYSPEIIIALDMAYREYGHDRSLLGIASQHGEVMLNGAGLEVARGLASGGPVPPFSRQSVQYSDGPDGREGGIGILRAGPADSQQLLLMKYTSHGLSHGHYDKLHFLMYDGSREIVQDYGAVRFINVEPKFGGRYLPETKSWAMQTIAHNTVTVDEQSHYQGTMAVSERYHADPVYFSASDPSFQVMTARVDNAYSGVRMQRTMAMVTDSAFARPVVIDLVRVESAAEHQYDLPVYYMGHLINTTVRYAAHTSEMRPLGTRNGYQHLWVEAEGQAAGPVQLSWLNGERYYTLTAAADSGTTAYFTRIGAGDPNFNLRHEPGFLLRTRAAHHVFASVLEPHGMFEPVRELSSGAAGRVQAVRVLASEPEGTVVEITGKDGLHWVFMAAGGPGTATVEHRVRAGSEVYTWTGHAALRKR